MSTNLLISKNSLLLSLFFNFEKIDMTGAWMFGDTVKWIGRRNSSTTGRGRGNGGGEEGLGMAQAPLQNRFPRHSSDPALPTSTGTAAAPSSAFASSAAPPVTAILFDMDGVLTLSEELSRLCGSRVMQKLYGFSE